MNLRFTGATCCLLACLAASFSSAAPLYNVLESPDTAPGVPQPVSATDLVNEGQATLDTAGWIGFTPFTDGTGTSSPAVLNDGSPGSDPDGGWNLRGVDTAVTVQPASWSLNYTLNTAASPNGYDLDSIEVMSLWTDDFVNQNFDVYVAKVDAPLNFNPLILGVVALEQDLGPNDVASSLKTVITDDAGALATNVAAIQFVFMTQDGRHAAYKEVDVFGAASVPEPASCVTMLIGCGLLIGHRRK